jgi:hypothetical protein
MSCAALRRSGRWGLPGNRREKWRRPDELRCAPQIRAVGTPRRPREGWRPHPPGSSRHRAPQDPVLTLAPARRLAWPTAIPRVLATVARPKPPSYLAFPGRRGFGFPSMGQAVKTHLSYTLSEVVLTASVRSRGRPERWLAEWDGRLEGGSLPEGGETPDPVAAGSFSAREREPSFYRGLWGPSLRSALQGGIAYPGGLGPEGPDQQFNGCSPLNRWDPGTDTSERLLSLRCFGPGQSLLAALSSLCGS